MSDTLTSYLNLVKPTVGASTDSWGGKTNDNWDILDAAVGASTPIGALIGFAGVTAPPGWLLADGTIYQISLYPALCYVIGNRWGGDGVTTFAVPDTRARGELGVGTTTDQGGNNVSLGFASMIGFAFVTLTQAVLPNYQLTQNNGGAHGHSAISDITGNHAHAGTTDLQGDHLHNFDAYQQAGGSGVGGGPPGFNTQTRQTDIEGAHQHNIQTTFDGYHQHNVVIDGGVGGGPHDHQIMLSGGGQQLEVLNPSYVATKIIYAGPPPVTGGRRVMLPAPMRLALRAPMRGSH